MQTKRPTRFGFTLIEILIVAAIMGILTSIITVSLSAFRLKAEATQALADIVRITSYLEAYKSNNGAYPLSCGSGAAWASRDANPWGCGLGACWIPEFSSEDPNWCVLFPYNLNPPVGSPNQSQYIYYTNASGTEYKLLYHLPVSMAVPAEFIDPIRPTWAFGTWTSGGASY